MVDLQVGGSGSGEGFSNTSNKDIYIDDNSSVIDYIRELEDCSSIFDIDMLDDDFL